MPLSSAPLQCSRIVLCSLAYSVVRLLLEILIVRNQSDPSLRAEVLALRRQLRVLKRQVGRPRWQPSDRILLAAASRILPRSTWLSLLPSPETLLRWHGDWVRGKWAAYRRRRPSRRGGGCIWPFARLLQADQSRDRSGAYSWAGSNTAPLAETMSPSPTRSVR
jgi:hypothetical protein